MRNDLGKPKERIEKKKIDEKCLYLNDLGEGVFKDGKGFGSASNFLKGEKGVVEKVESFSSY